MDGYRNSQYLYWELTRSHLFGMGIRNLYLFTSFPAVKSVNNRRVYSRCYSTPQDFIKYIKNLFSMFEKTSVMAGSLFKLGDVVALITHPYHAAASKILLMGEPTQQSPIMVISQIVELSERSLMLAESLGVYQYKCYWYSQRKTTFESAWISEAMLKRIDSQENLDVKIPNLLTKVILRSVELEQGKLRNSFVGKPGSDISDRFSVTAVTSYVSPMMIVIGYRILGEKKDCDKTQVEAVSVHQQLIKVKWFNYSSDKLSDNFIPVSCINEIPQTDEKKLLTLTTAVEKNEFASVLIQGVSMLIQPISIVYLSGEYYLQAIDILTNDIMSPTNIRSVQILSTKKSPILKKAPEFDFASQATATVYPQKIIQDAINDKKFIRIKYYNKLKRSSVRCLKDLKIETVNKNKKKKSYVSGYCMLKRAPRHFNLKRIQWVEMLDLSYE